MNSGVPPARTGCRGAGWHPSTEELPDHVLHRLRWREPVELHFFHQTESPQGDQELPETVALVAVLRTVGEDEGGGQASDAPGELVEELQ